MPTLNKTHNALPKLYDSQKKNSGVRGTITRGKGEADSKQIIMHLTHFVTHTKLSNICVSQWVLYRPGGKDLLTHVHVRLFDPYMTVQVSD